MIEFVMDLRDIGHSRAVWDEMFNEIARSNEDGFMRVRVTKVKTLPARGGT
jgi:hypothetical protein